MSEETVRLTRAQVREVDRLAIEKYHIPGIVLMENAAIAAANVAWDMLARTPCDITIICGGGNNGGDGFAIARHLHNRGCTIDLFLMTNPAELRGDALTNFKIVKAMGIMPRQFSIGMLRSDSGLIIDAIFGTGLSRPVSELLGPVFQAISHTYAKVLAIDLPSGLDCDTGQPLGPCIRATKTVTFVAEKAGFANPASRQCTGEVIVAGIGCPRAAIEEARRLSDSTP